MKITPIDLAWAAGFVDGEGSINSYYYPLKKFYNASFSIGQVDRNPLDTFVLMFGGHLCKRRQTMKNGRPIWIWKLSGDAAERALIALLPYLRLKKRQAELFIELRQSIRAYKACKNNPIPEAVRIKRAEIVSNLKALNRRGIESVIYGNSGYLT